MDKDIREDQREGGGDEKTDASRWSGKFLPVGIESDRRCWGAILDGLHRCSCLSKAATGQAKISLERATSKQKKKKKKKEESPAFPRKLVFKQADSQVGSD